MKAYFVSNFTKHPKLILENNQMIDLFDNGDDTAGVLLNAIDTVVSTYKLDEIVVANTQDKEMFEYLNTVYKFSDGPELKITLQEN